MKTQPIVIHETPAELQALLRSVQRESIAYDKVRFIQLLATGKYRTVQEAARAAGITNGQAYSWRQMYGLAGMQAMLNMRSRTPLQSVGTLSDAQRRRLTKRLRKAPFATTAEAMRWIQVELGVAITRHRARDLCADILDELTSPAVTIQEAPAPAPAPAKVSISLEQLNQMQALIEQLRAQAVNAGG